MKHEEISELLPWYATSTLEEGERVLVEEHLKTCGECRQELAELKTWESAEISLSESMPPLPANGLQRALAEIESYEARQAPAVETPGLLDKLRAFWAERPLLAQAVMAAQLVLVVGLGSMYWQSQQTIRTLGGPDGSDGGARISVQFEPSASEAQIRTLLEEVEATIVDGPSGLGLYTIELETDADEQGALEQLQGAEGVVSFAQPQPQ